MAGLSPPSSSKDQDRPETSSPDPADPKSLSSPATDQPEAGAGSSTQRNQAAEVDTGLDSYLIPQREAPSPSREALYKRIDTLEIGLAKREGKLLRQRHLIRQKEEMISHLLGGAQPFDPDKCYYCSRSGGTELIVQRAPVWQSDTAREERREAGGTYFFTGEDADRGVPGSTDLSEERSIDESLPSDSIDDFDVEVEEEQQADTGRHNVEVEEKKVADEPDHSRGGEEALGDWASKEGAGSAHRPTNGW